MTTANNTPDFTVYTIIENGDEDAKNYWQRLGTGWTNKDGSINVTLNALPVNGRLHLRAPKSTDADNA